MGAERHRAQSDRSRKIREPPQGSPNLRSDGTTVPGRMGPKTQNRSNTPAARPVIRCEYFHNRGMSNQRQGTPASSILNDRYWPIRCNPLPAPLSDPGASDSRSYVKIATCRSLLPLPRTRPPPPYLKACPWVSGSLRRQSRPLAPLLRRPLRPANRPR